MLNPLDFVHYKLPSPPEALSWPLHAKNVRQTRWQDLDGLICSRWSDRWKYYSRYFRDASSYQQMPCGLETRCKLQDADMRTLLANGLIEACQPQEVEGWVHCFAVPEVGKRRRRWIADPVVVNETFAVDASMRFALPSVEDCCQQVRLAPVAACIDLKAFYHQLPMALEVRRRFCFRDRRGNLWRLTTVPTGHRFVPGVAQAVVESLCDGLSCSTSCFIDNIRLIGARGLVITELKVVYARALAAGLTFNESLEEAVENISGAYTFLGVQYDHGQSSVALTQKNLDKLRRCLSEVGGSPSWWTVQSIFSLAGWCSRVLGFPLANVFWLIKFLRRRTQAGWRDSDPARIWPSTLNLWSRWLQELLENRPRRIVDAPPSAPVLFSDASLSGWGAVCVGIGIRIAAGAWPQRILSCAPPIAELEARALLAGLTAFGAEEGSLPQVHVRLDNTTIIGSLRRTCSRSFFINDIVGRILALPCTLLSCRYVESALNPADGLSRGSPFDPAEDIKRILTTL